MTEKVNEELMESVIKQMKEVILNLSVYNLLI